MSLESDARLAAYLRLTEIELLLELSSLTSERGIAQLHSPESRIREAQAFLARLRPRLQQLLCPRQDLLDLPEWELAATVAAVFTGSFVAPLAAALAAYIAKRGWAALCKDFKPE